MAGTFDLDLSASAPREDLPPPMKALWWLKKGGFRLGPEWHEAHEICQTAEGEPAYDWIHGLCHLIEADHGNAAYWFRRAGRTPATQDPQDIWREIAASLG
ncbi:hypothetical protein [Labrenzia sp. VG12]|uniref:hypothetical protein n=1 Tax=Labrenzia sp. VG12 TaxID=2021862 RepID=UPI0012FD1973|nr:hypothetical protein [Labrenzia sp. VG12]